MVCLHSHPEGISACVPILPFHPFYQDVFISLLEVEGFICRSLLISQLTLKASCCYNSVPVAVTLIVHRLSIRCDRRTKIKGCNVSTVKVDAAEISRRIFVGDSNSFARFALVTSRFSAESEASHLS